MTIRILILVAFLAPLYGCSSATKDEPINVLIFSRTQGFRHDSIPAGVKAMHQLCFEAGYSCMSTEDATIFTPSNLDQFRVVVFLNTTGDILDEEQQRAFERWFKNSQPRGVVAIHSAADTEYDWPFYQALLGGHFTGHPPVQEAHVICEHHAHPSTHMLPTTWTRTDEWYNYAPNPRNSDALILLTLDTNSYQGSTMPEDHPIAWCRERKDSRSRFFYTGGGHTIESFSEPLFLEHLAGGLRWAAHHAD